MPRFPTDAPKNRVIRALERLGYCINKEKRSCVYFLLL